MSFSSMRPLAAVCLFVFTGGAFATNVAQPLPFSQDWSNAGLITANDNWSGVPGIEGFLGQDITTSTGTDPQTLLGTSAIAGDLTALANQAATSITNGDVAEFDGVGFQTIALQGSGTADAPHLIINLDTTGQSNINVAYNLRDIDATADNAVMPVALQFRVGNSGNFTNIAAGFVADATTGPSLATLVTPVSVTLPAAANNQALVQVRIMTTNAAGNDEWVGVDDISITVAAAGPTVASSIPADDATGVARDGNLQVTFSESVALAATWFDLDCPSAADITAQVAPASPATVFTLDPDVLLPAGEACTLTILASGVSSSPGGTPMAGNATIDFTTAAAPTVSFVDDSLAVNEGNVGGTATLDFQITMAQPPAGAPVDFDVVVGVAGDSASSATDYTHAIPAHFTVTSATPLPINASIALTGDVDVEADETLTLRLSNFTGTAATQTTPLDAVGTIVNDDGAIVRTLSIADASGNEADTTAATATFVVTLSQALGNDLAVTAATADVTATGGAAAPADYQSLTAAPFTLTAGQTTFNIPVTVFGDLRDDDAETFTVSIATGDPGVQVTDGTATGTIVDNDTATMTIAQIQGDTGTSPVAASTQTTVNNVVTAVLNNGVMLQSIAPDADPNTSEGLLLFTGGVPALTGGGAIAVGDVLDVRGRIVEFVTAGSTNTVTEFSNSGPAPIIVRVGTGQALPAATPFDPFVSEDLLLAAPCTGTGGFRSNFECVEHMRGAVTNGTITGPNQTFATDPAAEMWFAFGTARTFREPGIRDEAFADPALAGLGLPRWDGNPEVLELDMDRLGQANTILQPGTLISAPEGILTSEFGGFEFWPSQPVVVAQPAPPQSNPVIDIPAGELAIGSINVENFFDTVQVSEAPAPAVDDDLTQAEFDAKMIDFVDYVCDTMKSPHVLGVVEIENQVVLDAMAAALNGRAGCLPGGVTYVANFGAAGPGTVEGNDPRYIDVGFLARSEVTVTAVTQLGKTQTTNECSGAAPCTLHDRPPLLLEGSLPVPNEAAMTFAVMINHLRSLNGIEGPDSPGVWTDANRIRRKRLDQGVDIARRVQALNVANPTRPLVLVGDYNAFEFTDGYADVINVIRGTANVASDALARDSQYEIQDLYPAEPGNIVNPPLTNALETLPAAEQYSYTFEGNAQTIDHVLLNGPAEARLSGFAYARGNADAPEAIDIDPGVPIVRDFRLTDHDGPVLRLRLANLIFSDGFED